MDPPVLSGDTLTFRPARTLLCPRASPSSSANLHGQNHAGWRAQRAQCLAGDWAPTRGLVVIRRPSYPPGRRRSREPDSLQRPPLWDPHGPDGHPASKSARLRLRTRLPSSSDAAVAPAATSRPVSAWGRVRERMRARARFSRLCVPLLSRHLHVLVTKAFSPLPGHPPTQISFVKGWQEVLGTETLATATSGCRRCWGGLAHGPGSFGALPSDSGQLTRSSGQ